MAEATELKTQPARVPEHCRTEATARVNYQKKEGYFELNLTRPSIRMLDASRISSVYGRVYSCYPEQSIGLPTHQSCPALTQTVMAKPLRSYWCNRTVAYDNYIRIN